MPFLRNALTAAAEGEEEEEEEEEAEATIEAGAARLVASIGRGCSVVRAGRFEKYHIS